MENNCELINSAIDLINEEKFSNARDILNQVIVLDNKNQEAYKNLGLCEVNLDNIPLAIEAFSRAYELDKNDTTSLFYLGSCYNQIGEKDLAIEKFSEVIEKRPDYIEVYKNIAMIYIELNQVDNAFKILDRALKNPNIEPDYTLYYIFATVNMLKKDYNSAISALLSALEMNPSYSPIINSLASCYMNVDNYDEALSILLDSYEKDKTNSLTIYNIGICYQVLGEYKKALEFFQSSYQLEPTTTMLATMANCAIQAQDYQLGVALYQNLVSVYPNNTDYRIAYIEALEMTCQYELALENINLLLMLDEKNVALIKKKGTNLRKLERNQESIETFNTLINRGKIDVEVYYNLAFNYVELEDFDSAKEMFKKCITLEPHNPYAHKDLGVLYLKMNCYDWAVDEMLDAIELDDTIAEFHYSLGVSYMMLSEVEEAKKAFNKALELDPYDADCLAYLGYVYMFEKEDDKALECLQKSLSIAPDNFLAKNYSAKYYFKKGNLKVAKEFLLDIIEKVQDDETMNLLGICYLENEEFDNALGIFYKLVLNYPENHILLTNLAKCEYKSNRKKEAVEHLRQALMVFDDYKDALDLLEEINNGN